LSGAHADIALALAGFRAGYSAAEIKVHDVDLRLARGSLTALIGPNGAGKSTLLKGVLGLTPVHTPERVRILGQPLDAVRVRVAYLPQRSEIDWDFPLRAVDVVAMGLYARIGLFRRVGRDARTRAARALDLVGLADAAHTPIGALSGGQRQRVLVARALAQEADLLLLDEPFANVDAQSERTIAEALQRLRAAGATILAVHHDLASVRAHFDDAVVLHGTVRAHGRAGDVLAESAVARVFGFAGADGRAWAGTRA